MVRPTLNTRELLDDLAWSIHEYLMDESTLFEGNRLVLIPVTALVKKFQRNHRTIARRLAALKDEGVLIPLIKKDFVSLYHIKEQDED